jgi:hypothetical protein
MKKRGIRLAVAIEPTQIARADQPIPLELVEIDHLHALGSVRSELIVI